MRISELITSVFRILKHFVFTECKTYKKRWLFHAVFLGVLLTQTLEGGGQYKWVFVGLLILLDRTFNFILLRRGL